MHLIPSETRETPRLRPGFLLAFWACLTLAALSGTPAGALTIGMVESIVTRLLGDKPLPATGPTTDGQALRYDTTTGRLVWEASSATIGGSLGSTDNAILTADGTGGVTAQGTTATLGAGVLTLPAGGVFDASSTGIVKAGSGAVSAVVFSIGGDANTGFYGVADSSLSFAIGGTRFFLIDTGGPTVTNGSMSVNGTGSASAVAYEINADANTGLYGTADSNVSVAVGGTQIAAVGTRGLTARLYPEAVTGNYTLADTQSMQVLTNTGAGGALEIELGSITATGFAITVVATDNQDITLDPGSSDKFVGLAGGWADGEAMILDDQNDAVRLVRLSTGDWLVEWTRGTLTEETP